MIKSDIRTTDFLPLPSHFRGHRANRETKYAERFSHRKRERERALLPLLLGEIFFFSPLTFYFIIFSMVRLPQ